MVEILPILTLTLSSFVSKIFIDFLIINKGNLYNRVLDLVK